MQTERANRVIRGALLAGDFSHRRLNCKSFIFSSFFFFCLFPQKNLVHSVQPHKHTFASSDATPVQTSDDDTQILKMSEQQAPVDYLHRYPAAH